MLHFRFFVEYVIMIILLSKFADWVDDYGMCIYLILAIIQIHVFAFVLCYGKRVASWCTRCIKMCWIVGLYHSVLQTTAVNLTRFCLMKSYSCRSITALLLDSITALTLDKTSNITVELDYSFSTYFMWDSFILNSFNY